MIQVDYLFSAELCDEEQRLQEEATEQMRLREEERATRGSPSMARHAETKMQKGLLPLFSVVMVYLLFTV